MPVILHLYKGADEDDDLRADDGDGSDGSDRDGGDRDGGDGDGGVYRTVMQTVHWSSLLLCVTGQQRPCP